MAKRKSAQQRDPVRKKAAQHRGLVEQKDGSHRFTYRRQAYALRVRRHIETDTWEVVSIWSEARRQFVPVEHRRDRDRWEALLAGELNRSLQEAWHCAERAIEAWLERVEHERYPA